jgi:TRAP-type C4-dicarboxylate transport system permease small subunit
VLDRLTTKFRKMFALAIEWLLVSLMLWKNWLGWKQFIRTKHARFGTKTLTYVNVVLGMCSVAVCIKEREWTIQETLN